MKHEKLALTERFPEIPKEYWPILQDARYQYESFIGIVTQEFSEEEINSDREKYPHLLKFTESGKPIYVDKFAVRYLALKTKISLKICARFIDPDLIDDLINLAEEGEVESDLFEELNNYYLTLIGERDEPLKQDQEETCLDFDFDEENLTIPNCFDCKHFHGEYYNNQLFICAIHPEGRGNCPYWEEAQ